MIRYALARLGYLLSLQAGVILCTFVLFNVVPSDPARVILGANASEAQIAALRREMGLETPVLEQMAGVLVRSALFDFGRSHVDGRPIGPEIAEKLGISAVLVSLSVAIAIIYVGAAAFAEFALRGRIAGALDFLWVSAPSMFSAVVLGVLAAHYYPFTWFSGNFQTIEDLLYFIPPAVALSLYPMAVLSRILRGEIRRLREAPFVVAARAVGFSEGRILGSYVLRNSLIPVLSAAAGLVPALFAGAYIVEVIFSVPGIGSLIVKSLLQRDLPMLQALVVVNGFVVIAVHFVVEILYPIVDPRIALHET